MDDRTLEELHEIIQIAMGWDDMHMHAFVIDDEQYGHGGDFEYDSRRVRLSEIAANGHSRFQYDYDFGDGWVHIVEIEKKLPAEEGVRYLFNDLAEKKGLHWQATSRGLRTWTVGTHEGPLSEFAAYRLTTLGVPFNRMRYPIQLTAADLEEADLVVALKKTEHHAMMLQQFPQWADRIQYWHVNDLDCATADEALPICEACVTFLVKTLLAEQESPTRLRRAA